MARACRIHNIKHFREIRGSLDLSNVFVLATGPLTSDIISQSDRVSIEFISPPTRIWGSIYVGTRRTFVTEDFRVGVKN